MLRVRTSAGRSPDDWRSMPIERSTASGVRCWPLPSTDDHLVDQPLDQRDVADRAVEGDLVAAHVARRRRAKARSTTRSTSSRLPSSATMSTDAGTSTVWRELRPGCCAGARGDVGRLARRAARRGWCRHSWVGVRRHFLRLAGRVSVPVGGPGVPVQSTGGAQPGGHANSRPPSTCPWTWNTLCPTLAPVLKTRRQPSSPSCSATAVADAAPSRPARRRRPRPARRRRGGARRGSPARAWAPSGRGRGRRPPTRCGARRRRATSPAPIAQNTHPDDSWSAIPRA